MAEYDENIVSRTIPHANDAEQNVIGAMLRDNNAVAVATEMLTEDDFYSKQYSILFGTMRELFNKGKPVDLVTTQAKLQQLKSVPAEMTEIRLLRDTMSSVVTTANVEQYCRIVKDKSTLRSLIRASEEVAQMAFDGNDEVEDILASSEKKMFDVFQQQNNREFVPIEEITMNVIRNIERASRNSEPITGIPSGFTDLDYKTAGFQKSDLVLIAARPSMGKTAFVLNILDYVGVKKGLPCLVFSLEMSKEQLVQRVLSMESLVDADQMRKGSMSSENWDEALNGADRISRANIVIDDTPAISVSQLRSKCRKVKLERGLSLIMIDYLQLMTGSSRGNDNRQQEISEISRSLKAIARETECPVLALSQLSRAVEQRPDHRPMLSDLRESGAIEQDADVVMFLYRDDYYHPDTERPGVAEVIIAKQRNGPIGTIELLWQAQYTRFVNKG